MKDRETVYWLSSVIEIAKMINPLNPKRAPTKPVDVQPKPSVIDSPPKNAPSALPILSAA
jgi:hypothetical protein